MAGHKSIVGAGLLAKAERQIHKCRLIHRFREQARSHIYGSPLFCNTVFDDVFGLLSSIRRLSGGWSIRALMRIDARRS